MPRKKRKGKDLEFLKSPTHVEGFLSLSNDEWGRAAKAVYRNYYGDDAFVRFGGALEDTEPQTGHGQSLKEFLWMTANNGITAYRETCDRNAIAGEISAQKRKEQNAIVNECQRVSTSVDTNQQVSTNRIEENRIEEKKKIPKENAQIEFALEGGACSGKHEKATCYSFEDFWKDYPLQTDDARRVDEKKKQCQKKFEKLKEPERELLKAAVAEYKSSLIHEGRTAYQLNVLTFLNAEDWREPGHYKAKQADGQTMPAPNLAHDDGIKYSDGEHFNNGTV